MLPRFLQNQQLPLMGEFNLDNPWWKIAVVLALLGMTGLARLFGGRDPKEDGKWLVETLDSATIAIALVLFVIQPFILQAFYIPSGSMENTLLVSDRLVVSRLIYRFKEPEFQDVIVFVAPPTATDKPNTDFIKRCMGTPGDVVEMRAGKFYRQGKFVPESYVLWDNTNPVYDMKIYGDAVYARDYYGPGTPGQWSQNNIPAPQADQDKITAAAPGAVPDGKLLMLGDHRSNSDDGHLWGFAPRENVIGKALCVFWPPQRFGLVEKLTERQGKTPVSTAAVPVSP